MPGTNRNNPGKSLSRRSFLRGIIAVGVTPFPGALALPRPAPPVPRSDPAAHLSLSWTKKLPWERVVDISAVEGRRWEERLGRAQAELTARGGGVVYFPPSRSTRPEGSTAS